LPGENAPMGNRMSGTEFQGDGFSLTAFGRGWVQTAAQHPPSDPSRFSEVLQPFIGFFGEGFAQRATEASRCYRTTNYLACCVMAGAAAESILLAVAMGFSYEGNYYKFQNITVAPRPLQQPHPPIRIAAASPDTYPAVGARGLPIFINARYGSFAEFAPEIQAYREAYAAAGHPGRGQVYLRVPTYVAETEERAYSEPRESLMHFYREQAQRLRDSLNRAGTRAIEGRAGRLKRIENLTYDEALTGQVLVGTPDALGQSLRALQDELGIDGILAELNCGGLIPHRQVMTALELLCQEVMPQFH